GAARAVCVPDSFDLYATARHSYGKRRRCDTNSTAYSFTVAVDDEVLEDEPPAWSVQLVGTNGVARRLDWNVALQTASFEWSELYVAALDVFGCNFREKSPANG